MSDMFARRAEEAIRNRGKSATAPASSKPDEEAPATSSRPNDKKPAAHEGPELSPQQMMAYPADIPEKEGLKVQGWFEWLDEKAAGLFHETWEGIGESWNGGGRAGQMAAQAEKHNHHHHANNDPEPPGATPPGAPRGRSGGGRGTA
jgi:hypothetical protein